jgi:hypothetical protein
MQEKSEKNFPFNTQVQEKSVESDSRFTDKSLINKRFALILGKA